jgi:hypothetical protein
MSLEPWSLDGEEEVMDFAMFILDENRVGGFDRDDDAEVASLLLSVMRYFERLDNDDNDDNAEVEWS